MRLDKYLQIKFNLKSRTYAENLIKTSAVTVDGKTVLKTSFEVSENSCVKITENQEYASQGAYKLLAALEKFQIDLHGKSAADIGCSNGGFTDVLLKNGVAKVLAIDVGECALPKSITDTGKVIFLRANARELPSDVEKVDFVCVDVSFISLKYILPSIYSLLNTGGEAVALIKPQFELDKPSLSKNGIVQDAALRQKAVSNVIDYAKKCGFIVISTETSPVRYENKNVEYLLYLKKNVLIDTADKF